MEGLSYTPLTYISEAIPTVKGPVVGPDNVKLEETLITGNLLFCF